MNAAMELSVQDINKILDDTHLLASPPPTKYESVPANELAEIKEIAALTQKLLQQRYPKGKAKRGVHPKDHGCVTATFTVNNDIPKNYQQGVFAEPGKSYQAKIRFSNATSTVENDVSKGKNNQLVASSRGIAIKLLEVKGKTLLDEQGVSSQDFLMINLPVFAFSDVAEYLELTRVQFANNDDISSFFQNLDEKKITTAGIVKTIQATQVANPVDASYFSAAPFLLGGDTVVKFSVKPVNPGNAVIPENPSPNYLRAALKKSLDPKTGKTVEFDFLIQVRSQDSLLIEDATNEWDEKIAPFEKVARMTIEPQDFDTPERKTECENLVFTPWHGLVEHQPLGGINRLRKMVYLVSSQYRQKNRN